MSSDPLFFRPLYCAHEWVARFVSPGDSAVDATAGNGHDSLFLAELVGPKGRVDIFDIQEQAMESTRLRLDKNGCLDGRVRFHLRSHADMESVLARRPKAVMFNLGYLPGGDKDIISTAGETVRALEQATRLLAGSGILTVVCYPGHDGGDDEARAVEQFLVSLPERKWTMAKLTVPFYPDTAPFLLALYKREDG